MSQHGSSIQQCRTSCSKSWASLPCCWQRPLLSWRSTARMQQVEMRPLCRPVGMAGRACKQEVLTAASGHMADLLSTAGWACLGKQQPAVDNGMQKVKLCPHAAAMLALPVLEACTGISCACSLSHLQQAAPDWPSQLSGPHNRDAVLFIRIF